LVVELGAPSLIFLFHPVILNWLFYHQLVHLSLIEYCVSEYGDKLCIIGNTGSNSTRECIHATREGFQAGMHGSLQINPYYGKSNKKGIIFHI
jgi:dihydrodipicolinate synthase/N-acetylneuraminate lyase